MRNSPTEPDRCHAYRFHVTSRWNIRDSHGSHAKQLVDNYFDDRTYSGKRRAAPFGKVRDSVDEKVVGTLSPTRILEQVVVARITQLQEG